MLEEKNDNLLEADGNLENNSVETTQAETTVLEEVQTVETSDLADENVETVLETSVETENETAEVTKTPVADEIEVPQTIETESVEPIDAESETIAETKMSETDIIIDAIADNNAEESEDETLKERHDIPMLDYDTLSMESLIDELKNLVTNEKVMSVKDHVEEIKK
ncbi:MAG TPA: hypothetical protein PLB11_02805, partial [Flavobacterium sp.]|nr:hypothetical protein [Flavobacterium sp.]